MLQQERQGEESASCSCEKQAVQAGLEQATPVHCFWYFQLGDSYNIFVILVAQSPFEVRS